MWKVNLVLADIDERYIESLSKFIRSSYTNKFNVNVFTKMDSLINFLDSSQGKIDILMITPEMFCEEMKKYKPGITILLSDNNSPDDLNGLAGINKFQAGEVILDNILELYGGVSQNVKSIVKGSKPTSIISVYSPVGGSGKTSIAIALAVLYAKSGLDILYLNLETINSMPFFIKPSNIDKGMSNLLFYLKESKKNLSIKIDTLKSYDNILGINYFNPVDCCLEMDELTEFDIGTLIFELKEIGKYDVIVIDMESVLNRRNLAILNNSDIIVVPVLQDVLSIFKLQSFERELKKINFKEANSIDQKIIPVINRFQSSMLSREISIFGKEICVKIPFETDSNAFLWNEQGINSKSPIFNYVEEVWKIILENNLQGKKGSI